MSTPDQPQRVAFYARISKKGDPVDQVADQLRRLQQHVDDYMPGAEVVGEYPDRFTSAWDDNVRRPQWEALRVAVRAGKIDRVMAVDQDRLSRHGGYEWVEFFERDCRKAGVVVHTIARGELDPNNRGDRLSGYVAADSSQSESQHKSDRLRAGSDRRRSLGLPRGGGVRPFGWNRSDPVGGRVFLTEHPVEGPMIRKAVTMLIGQGGVGLTAIVKQWNAPGQPTTTRRNKLTGLPNRWTHVSVKAVLTRSMNCGLVQHRGVVLRDSAGDPVRGQWPVLVSEEHHNAVVALIDSRKTGVAVDPRWLMTGLIRCHCGEVVRATVNGRQQQVYRCSSSFPRLPAEGGKHIAVDIPMIDGIVISAVVDQLFTLPKWAIPGQGDSWAALSPLYAHQREIERRRTNVIDMGEAGAISAAEVAPRMTKIRAELAEVEEQILQLQAGNARSALVANAWRAVHDPLSSTLTFGQAVEIKAKIREGFEALELAERRALVAALVTVEIGPGRGAKRVEVTPKIEIPEHPEHDDEIGSGLTGWRSQSEADLIESTPTG
ncbi:MAG: recombinase family protein [Nakamurella sp.]